LAGIVRAAATSSIDRSRRDRLSASSAFSAKAS
jgi:hypothetical protein